MINIQCEICQEDIQFNLNNPDTFLSVTESGNPFTGKIINVRLAHTVNNERHINVVVLDVDGLYKTHKDSYIEKKQIEQELNWEQIKREFPFEIRHYLDLAEKKEQGLLCKITELEQKDSLLNFLVTLWNEYPENQLLAILAAKWSFLSGKNTEIILERAHKQEWIIPVAIRLRSRFNPSEALFHEINSISFEDKPINIQLEWSLAQSEVYLRLAKYEELSTLYHRTIEKWQHDTHIEVKKYCTMIEAYYAFSLYRQGKLKASLELTRPLFSFAKMLEDKELLITVGTLYGSILRADGNLGQSYKVYNEVLEVSKDLQNERNQVVISNNLGIIETMQGAYHKALDRYLKLIDSPTVKSEFHIRNVIYINLSDIQVKLKNYSSAVEYAKKVVVQENISLPMKIALLNNLKLVTSRIKSRDLLDYIKTVIAGHDEKYFKTPNGRVFILDLQTIENELNEDWFSVIGSLKSQLSIIKEHSLTEQLSEIEIRIAEAFFKLFEQSHEMNYLHNAYDHLDLAKTIALEAGYNADLCKLIFLKGMIASALNIQERAKSHLLEAQTLAKEHKLDELLKEINPVLKRIEQGLDKESDSQKLETIFKNLRETTNKGEKDKNKSEVNIKFIWVQSKNFSWERVYVHKKEEDQEKSGYNLDGYLKGLRALWPTVKHQIMKEARNSFEISNGILIKESSDNFQALILADKSDYMTRITIQTLLEKLEKFPLKNIGEELSGLADDFVIDKYETLKKIY